MQNNNVIEYTSDEDDSSNHNNGLKINLDLTVQNSLK